MRLRETSMERDGTIVIVIVYYKAEQGGGSLQLPIRNFVSIAINVESDS